MTSTPAVNDIPPLRLDKVSFWYQRDACPIVFDCTFEVTAGEIVAIVGRSGAGKSTLLRIACGLLGPNRPSSGAYDGSVTVGDKPVAALTHKLGFVPQDFSASLMPWLSCEDNVLLAVASEGLTKEEREKAKELLRECGLGDVAHLNIRRLSGGQQQRTAICRALITGPSYLFMDEPFANLDSRLRSDISEFLADVRRRDTTSILFVTHDLVGALDLADRVIAVRCTYGLPEYASFVPSASTRQDIEEWTG